MEESAEFEIKVKSADIYGRPYTRIGSLRDGCLVQFDDGHGDCLPDRSVRKVRCDAAGEFYVECSCGKHYIGYIEEEVVVVGVYQSPLS